MSKGYAVTDFNGLGIYEIEKIDEENVFEDDEEAVEQAIKDGVKSIPEEELPPGGRDRGPQGTPGPSGGGCGRERRDHDDGALHAGDEGGPGGERQDRPGAV